MKFFIKKRLDWISHQSSSVNAFHIDSAQKILFCVLSRYGDGIISFSIIKQFIKRHPDKKYIILTSRQLLPYAKEILGDHANYTIIKINIRNSFSFIRTALFLKREKPDIGLNPWGHGNDSEYFVSFAKHFYFYKSFSNFGKTYNLYDRVRKYLHLEIISEKRLKHFDLSKIHSILIAPLSTDTTKNLSEELINNLLERLTKQFPQAHITTAVPAPFRNTEIDSELFLFRKSNANSSQFLSILKDSDLFIGVDSGPLHLALALGIRSIAIFGPTSPRTIFDDGHNAKYLRNPLLKDSFCFVKSCTKPDCINQDILSDLLSPQSKIDHTTQLVTDHCSMKNEIMRVCQKAPLGSLLGTRDLAPTIIAQELKKTW
jgi:ADP-heptose:LPS heptosyltransferase